MVFQIHDSGRIATRVVVLLAPTACGTLTRNPVPESATLEQLFFSDFNFAVGMDAGYCLKSHRLPRGSHIPNAD
jgi:hypothetical protein